MHGLNLSLASLTFACLALAAPSASAAPAGAGDTTGKKIRVGVDTEFFGFGHINPDGGPSDDGFNRIGFGVGRALLTEQAFVNDGGFFGGVGTLPHVGLHAAAVILDGRALAGARLAFSMGGVTTEAEDDVHYFLFSGELIPYFRWMFLDGWVRPYLEGHFGFGGGLVRGTNTDPDFPNDANSATAHVIAPSVGAGGGAMLFLTESLSLDLGLGLDYAAPHARVTFEDEMPPVTENTDWDKASDNVVLNITAGISGWF